MWRQAEGMLGRLLARGRRNGCAADELDGMGPRELCDLGIGASEIPFVLEGGGRGCTEGDASGRDTRRPAAEKPGLGERHTAGSMPAGI